LALSDRIRFIRSDMGKVELMAYKNKRQLIRLSMITMLVASGSRALMAQDPAGQPAVPPPPPPEQQVVPPPPPPVATER